MFQEITNKNIKALCNSKMGVGKNIKNSKLKYSWNFELNKKKHRIDLFFSKMSMKIKILLNDKTCLDKRKILKLDFNMMIGEYQIRIFKKSVMTNEFILQINNKNFKNFQNKEIETNDEIKKDRFFSFKKPITDNNNNNNEQDFVDLNRSDFIFKHEINFLKISDSLEDIKLVKIINQS